MPQSTETSGSSQPLPVLDFPFTDNLESGGTNWLPDGQWTIVADEGYSGTHALSLNPGEDYQRSTDFAIELNGPITIAGDAVDPELTWYDRIEAAADTTLQIELSTNAGLDWIVLHSFSAADNSAEWTLREISLTDYVGKTICLII